MSDSNGGGDLQNENEGQAMASSAVRFVQAHPEFGIIPLLLVSVPILAPFVPEDSKIGPIIYSALVVVLLPMIDQAARFLIEKLLTGFAKAAASHIFQWGVGIAIILFVAALLGLGIVLATDEDNGNAFNRLTASIWELVAKNQICDGNTCTEPTVEQGQEVVISGVAPRPENDPLIRFIENVNDELISPNEQTSGVNDYDDCIKRAYEKKDAEEIVSCSDILEK